MFQIFRNKQYKYEAVNGGSRVRSHYKYPTIWITTAIVVASALTGFYTGRLSVSINADPGINCKVPAPSLAGSRRRLTFKKSIHSEGNLPLQPHFRRSAFEPFQRCLGVRLPGTGRVLQTPGPGTAALCVGRVPSTPLSCSSSLPCLRLSLLFLCH